MDLRKHLEEQQNKDFHILKQLEDKFRYEDDPRLKNKWNSDIIDTKEIIHRRQVELESLSDAINIEAFVNSARKKCYDKIKDQCGSIQLLDVSCPIEIGSLYVDVNILENVNSRQWREISDLLQGLKPTAESFDRLGLGRITQNRIQGFEAVSRYSKLMVLGKPGSGKTVLLQHLAICCNEGQFFLDYVPIFIKLKNYSEECKDVDEFLLEKYIINQFSNCGIKDPLVVKNILTCGKMFVLLDGLDEVLEGQADSLVHQIRRFCEQYYRNQFVITCRVAAQKYRFPGFTDVEVADFNQNQIENFARKWFAAIFRAHPKESAALANDFIEQIKLPTNSQVRELAVTPILLNLTCLVFHARSKFPTKRINLYEDALEILLRKWDETRGIKRDEIYRFLSLERKKDLLSQVAEITFEKGHYYFSKREVEQGIAVYLKTLSDSQDSRSKLQGDSEVVLNSIEAQHGLLVERAHHIYSFSHLTFHEYFVARSMVNSFSSKSLGKTIKKVTSRRWREVFLLAVGLFDNADELLILMKQHIDKLAARHEKIHRFLKWVYQKSTSSEAPYKLEAMRAFYFSLACADENDLEVESIRDVELARTLSRDLQFKGTQNFNFARELADAHTLTRDVNNALDLSLTHALLSVNSRDYSFNLDRVINLSLEPNFRQALQRLREEIPEAERTSPNWIEQLRNVAIEYRNIGHSWHFDKQEVEILEQYYYANRLIFECLNIGCDVSFEIEKEIRDNLLLPIDIQQS